MAGMIPITHQLIALLLLANPFVLWGLLVSLLVAASSRSTSR